jgi:DNA-binding NtrC family response regulator
MSAEKAGTGQIVLIVEDEPMQRVMAADMLYDAGFWSLEAADAYQALHTLEVRGDIRIVFVDIRLPYEFSGLELAEIVRRRWPEIEIILTSGSVEIVDTSLPDGAVFLRKPYRSQDILPVLRQIAH